MKYYKYFLFVTGISFITSTFGSDTPSQKDTSKQVRKKSIESQKSQLDIATQKRLKERATGRKIQEAVAPVIEATGEINEFLFHLPLIIRQQHGTAVVAILNQVVRGVSVGIRAIGRRKEAIQAILGANEQILEAAIRSYEKIKAQTIILEELLGQKTIIEAFKDIPSSNISKSDKILNLLTPYHYLNTFNKFTDSLYITDNKADRWEQVKATSADLREEEKRFDDYMAMLEIKVLEKQMMNLHLQQNAKAYTAKLQESLKAIMNAIDTMDNKINALKGQSSSNKGILNRLKKTVGKDAETQNAKDLVKLIAEREQYQKQKADVEAQIKQYQEMTIDPSAIQQQREKIKSEIANVKGRRVAAATLDEVVDEVSDLKKQITSLITDMNQLKEQSSQTKTPKTVSRPLPSRPGAPTRTPSGSPQTNQG